MRFEQLEITYMDLNQACSSLKIEILPTILRYLGRFLMDQVWPNFKKI